MAKKEIYVCNSCGAEFPKWAGKCDACGEWNTLKEMRIDDLHMGVSKKARSQKTEKLSKVKIDNFEKIKTGISEFDLSIGGGFIPGSVMLLGGEPGIGKSTLILQMADNLSLGHVTQISKVLYVSGEESFGQIKTRANRLKIKSNIELLAETDVRDIIATAKKLKPIIVIVDSIQTIIDPSISSSAGSIAQVKAGGLLLQKFAKESNIPVVLIGHVTKQGGVAGPKTLEHLVDTVAYLEGERFHSLRILRCSKNRYGSVNEVGVFEMTQRGLSQVKNASAQILSQRKDKTEGSAITVILEGTRPFIIEIQALASKSYLGFPQRKASGFDYNRMQLLIAVLASRAGLGVGNYDIYLNIVGGLKVKDPSCDLAAAVAIASAIKKKSIKKDLVILGELGLAGDIRTVLNLGKRIKEAKSLGFKKVIVPKFLNKKLTSKDRSFKMIEVGDLKEAIRKSLTK